MKYAVEMGSGAIIYIPSFIKIGSGIRKLIVVLQTHKQYGDLISLFLFLQNNGNRLKVRRLHTVRLKLFSSSIWFHRSGL
jgi:hypothetical protein